MKRTSVRYNVTPSYSYNPTSERESKKIRLNSCLVLFVGILLIVGIIAFISKNYDASLLLSAGILYPRQELDNASDEENGLNVTACIIGIVICVIGVPLAFILA
jgi:hypothetical protein